MKAIYLKGPNSWKIADLPIPEPAKGQVLVKMAFAPVNPSDLAFLTGNYGIKKDFPVVPGIEGSGEVVKSGGGFYANFLKGKNIACTSTPTGNGTWAEFMITNANSCVPLNSAVSLDQGSMLFVNPLTAISFIKKTKDEQADVIVLTAAASALAKMICFLAKNDGIPVIGILRDKSKLDSERIADFKSLIESNSNSFESELKTGLLGFKKALFFDAIGGSALPSKILSMLPVSSKMINYGRLDQVNTPIYNPQDLLFKNHSMEGFWLSNEIRKKSFLNSMLDVRKVQTMLKSGFETEIYKKVKPEELENSILDYQSNMSKGKVLLDFT